MPLQAQLNPVFLQRLTDSIIWSRKQLEVFQSKRMTILRQYVGRHYGGNMGCTERVPQNYIRQFLSTFSRHLVTRSPSVLCEAADPRLRPIAFGLQQWANMAFPAMGLERTLKCWAIEALVYPIGLLKVCTGYGPSAHDGHPDLVAWADYIDPERQVYDMMASKWTQLDYIGHRYTAAKEDLKGPGFDEALAASLQPEQHHHTTDQGAERTESIQQIDTHMGPRVRDYVECWEIYLPKENLLVTFPIYGTTIDPRPLRVEQYIGPRNSTNTGPFHILGFDEVTGALMPTPPIHAIFDLHEAANRGARKLLRQMERQKELTLYGVSGQGDAQKVRNANDGDMVPVSDPSAFQTVRKGGPDQNNLAYNLHLSRQISYFGGNMDVIGGQGSQAPTATQEKLLAASSSQLVQFYQDEMTSRTKEVCEALLWHEWHSRRPMEYTVMPEGMPEFAQQAAITAQDRYGGGVSLWGKIGIDVHPYSMRPVSPETRVAQWTQLWSQVILPAAPMLIQQGASIDFVAFVKKLAGYLGLKDLDEVLKILPILPVEGQQGAAEMPRTRPPGTGEYTRTSVSGPEDQDQEILSMMGEPEGVEAA